MAVSLLLVAVFFYLFGYWSIIRLMDDGITVSQSQIEPVNIKPPGISLLIFLTPYTSGAEEIKLEDKSTKLNVYTGMFDFSDDGKKSHFNRSPTSE